MVELTSEKRILLVEDEELILEVLVELLTDAGFKVDCARDGQEAINKISGGGYDLLITDGNLPKIQGAQVAAEFLSKYPKKPIAMISGHLDPEKLVNEAILSSVKFFSKPFDSRSLLDWVKNASV